MNPFDLRGPEFLAFFVGLGFVTWLVLEALDRRRRPSTPSVALLRDPYLVAGLRGGEDEVARLATLSLLGRGLLRDAGTGRVARTAAPAVGAAGAPPALTLVEKELLAATGPEPRTLARLVRKQSVRDAARHVVKPLHALGLVAGGEEDPWRVRASRVALALLLTVAVVKLVVALSRGRTNVLFLLVLAGLAAWAFTAWGRRRTLTPARRSVLADLRRLFGAEGGFVRWKPTLLGALGSDLLLSAAVLGFGGGPFRRMQERTSGSGDSGGWFGSSCGSSCGSGGCGGGGGGCGGCGS